jgi:hypothetical protein
MSLMHWLVSGLALRLGLVQVLLLSTRAVAAGLKQNMQRLICISQFVVARKDKEIASYHR